MTTKSNLGTWLVATLVMTGILNWISIPLINEVAPWGLFSWQLAATPQRAQAILASWDGRTQLLASFGLGLDYLFLFVYAVTLNLACQWSAHKLERQRFGNWIGAAIWMAALFDALENACLAIGLVGKPVSPYPEVAALSAAIKFTLIFVALGWTLLGAFAAIRQKRALSAKLGR